MIPVYHINYAINLYLIAIYAVLIILLICPGGVLKAASSNSWTIWHLVKYHNSTHFFLDEQSESIKKDITKLEKEIYELAGTEFNIASPKQLGEILFEKLELQGAKKTKTGAYQTGEEILVKLKDEHPIINKILDYRTLSKLYNNYVVGLIDEIKWKIWY